MSFFNPIHKLKIGVVEKTIREAINKGYDVSININGEIYLIDEEGTSSSQDEKLRFSSVEVL